MTRKVPAHYIRENKAAQVPRRIVVMDCEARSTIHRDHEIQEWRCGAVYFGHWTNTGRHHHHVSAYTSATVLWNDIAEHTRPKQRTVIYCHNLPYDMRISNCLEHLPRLGFHLDAIRASSKGCWSRWSRNGASLILVDSASLFPVTVHRLGLLYGTKKLALPQTDNIDDWLRRCTRDVDITARIIVEYFGWLRTGVAGNWQLTGAGQSWSHWRHAHLTHPVLVHTDGEAIEAERRAMWTGRAENWQWGRDYEIPVYEWDWENAYPRIARDIDIPTRLVGKSNHVTLTDLHHMMKRWIILADLEVTTDQPVVPARHDGHILWPVGTFTTTLWQPEIEALLAAGASIRVSRVWLYQGAPALRSWATWMLDTLHGRGQLDHPWQTILLKHWSRALIGRFATQYQNWELFGWDTRSNVMAGRMHDTDTGEDLEFMQVGNEIHVMTGLEESDDSCPQITSYIMSVARARLWEAISACGWQNVLYMDTDSLVVNMTGHTILQRATRKGEFEGLRLKGRHSGYEIYGPRSAIIGDSTKFAGIPRNARRLSDDTWRGEVWTQFERALRIGEHNKVSIAPRNFTVRWNERRRARSAQNRTVPYQLPEYQPAGPFYIPEPTTDTERVRHTQKTLHGKRVLIPEHHSSDLIAAATGHLH